MTKKSNGPVRRYMILEEDSEKIKIKFNSQVEANEHKKSLQEEMAKSREGGFLYDSFRFYNKKYSDSVTLQYVKYKIISRLSTLEELDKATITKYIKAEGNLVEYTKVVNGLSKLLIAYRSKGTINKLKLLTPEEARYVITRNLLSNRIIALMNYECFNIYNFCHNCDIKTRYFKTKSDLEDFLEDIENAAERYEKGATDNIMEIQTAIRNFVNQLYYGVEDNPKYKRFREIGLYVKSIHDKYQKRVGIKQTVEPKIDDLQKVLQTKIEQNPEEPMQLKFNLY